MDSSINRCADVLAMAERELAAFRKAVTQLFGPEQARVSGEEWLRELSAVDALPASTREWRTITTKVVARLAERVSAASILTEAASA